jgi:outer membrane receptor protein involved in Fe transport
VDTFRFIGSAVPGVASGNTDLKEEDADTFTIGTVFTPQFNSPLFARLSGSVDYYHIALSNAIGVLTAAVSLPRCFNADGLNPSYSPSNYYCQLTTRNSSGDVLLTKQPTLNLGGYHVDGVDAEVDWGFDLGAVGLSDSDGSLDINLLVSYLNHFSIQNQAGQPYLNYAGTIGNRQVDYYTESYPSWKASGSVTYSNGPASVAVRWRWYDAMINSANVGTSLSQPGVTARIYFDLAGTYDLSEKYQFRAGIKNLINTDPPTWTGDGNTDTSLYDILGRRFYVGVTAKL